MRLVIRLLCQFLPQKKDLAVVPFDRKYFREFSVEPGNLFQPPDADYHAWFGRDLLLTRLIACSSGLQLVVPSRHTPVPSGASFPQRARRTVLAQQVFARRALAVGEAQRKRVHVGDRQHATLVPAMLRDRGGRLDTRDETRIVHHRPGELSVVRVGRRYSRTRPGCRGCGWWGWRRRWRRRESGGHWLAEIRVRALRESNTNRGDTYSTLLLLTGSGRRFSARAGW
mmetsp:Transcript_19739/g.49609  ORF Transcript_19739/g.49609 Transcript_19739/m.49609 type:complete len:227 (+) Transcript_19739:261-941(+)